ncbi:MAG TPA: phage tail tip lysozyme [Sporichthyaceae bacterium]|nr:phage tail tip lysozyme [Sporichthyaceae bacterium]
MSQGAQPSGTQKAKGRHRRPSAVRKAALAAPVVMASGAMAVAPAFMTAPQAHLALAQATTHAATARLDAVVTPAAPAAAAATAATAPGSYAVQAGNTLYGIALSYYGNGYDWPTVYQANQTQISNPNLIYAGQVLTIPQTAAAPATPAPAATTTSTPAPATPAPTTATTPAPTTATTPAPATATTTTTSTTGGSAAVQTDIADGDYLLAIGQYLVDNGYSAAAAAGVASCIDGESGGNPESQGDGGGGLIGWTPLGSATPDTDIITGNPATDLLTQLADILYYNTNEIGQTQVDELNSQTDPVAAADFYSQNFERPAVTDSDVVPSVAEQIYSELGS